MRKIRYRRPGIPVLTRRAMKELKAMPEPDENKLRKEAEACKRRILEAKKKERRLWTDGKK